MVRLFLIILMLGVQPAYAIVIQNLDRNMEWLGADWEEREDVDQFYWSLEQWQLQINNAKAGDLTLLPMINTDMAAQIIKTRKSKGKYLNILDLKEKTGLSAKVLSAFEPFFSFENKPFTTRVRIRGSRRYGQQTDEDSDRYDGSPYGITQRLSASRGAFQGGLILQKDKFENDLSDLTRFHIAFRDGYNSIILGDFNFNAGYGLTLKTRPVYFTGFSSKSSFNMGSKGVSPAVETQQNSAFRGAGLTFGTKNLTLNLFAAETPLDAVSDDDGNILRLSSGGLHRTDGESKKKNRIRETAIGGLFGYSVQPGGKLEYLIFMTGYGSKFNHPLTPTVTAKDRFQLSGSQFGIYGAGLSCSGTDFDLGGEMSADNDGDIAWLLSFKRNISNNGKWDIRSTLYHFPAEYINPHTSSPSGNSDAQNKNGGALLLTGNVDFRYLNQVKAHIEVEQRDWRSYTVPSPFTASKGSLVLLCPLKNGMELQIRYRRKEGKDGNGEENPVTDFSEDKLRFTLRETRKTTYPFGHSKIWVETILLQESDTGGMSATGENSGRQEYRGFAAGFRIADNLQQLSSSLRYFRYSFSTSVVSSGNSLPIYLGEAEIPDRMASIRLSGIGIRWSTSLIYRPAGFNWIALQAGRTIRLDKAHARGDTELYLTASFRFQQKNE